MTQNTLDYSPLLTFLKDASLFEIYRLRNALDIELKNPSRIKAIQNQFKVSDKIEYFDDKKNALMSAVVLKKSSLNVLVENCADGQRWKIPYYLLNLNSRRISFEQSGRKLDKHNVKVGDWVGFDKEGDCIVGCVVRRNPKTVSMVTPNRHRWRVAYSLLYSIIDAECTEELRQEILLENTTG